MSAKWNIRRATPDDAPFLPEIEISGGTAFRSVPGLEWVADDEVWSAAEHLDWMDRAAVWVAENDQGKLVAFLITEEFEDALHIWEITVHHAEQGHGLGRQLLDVAEDHTRNVGLNALTLTTFRDLAFNEQFYSKMGYQTLHADQLTSRLQGALAKEAEEGLPAEKRCAMRKNIG